MPEVKSNDSVFNKPSLIAKNSSQVFRANGGAEGQVSRMHLRDMASVGVLSPPLDFCSILAKSILKTSLHSSWFGAHGYAFAPCWVVRSPRADTRPVHLDSARPDLPSQRGSRCPWEPGAACPLQDRP